MKLATWKGWEYLNKTKTHVEMSKRHLFVDGQPVCGTKVPRSITPSTAEGDYGCKRCVKWGDAHFVEKGRSENSFYCDL